MSGGPGGGVPECVGYAAEYYNTFLTPATSSGQFYNTYHPEEVVQLSWYGGAVLSSDSPPPQTFNLFFQNATSGGDYLLLGAMTIFTNRSFVWGTSSWTHIDNDTCSRNTQLSFNWTVPPESELGVSRFQLVAQNVTDANVTNVFSPGFSVLSLPSTSATSSSSSSATSLSTTGTPTPTTSLPVQSGSAGLSTGAKSGIGVGCALVAIFISFGIFIFFRRMDKRGKSQTGNDGSLGYDKAELDGRATEKGRAEIDDVHRVELHHDSVGERIELEAEPAVELPAG